MAGTNIAINITGNTADITKKLNQVNTNLTKMGSKAGGARTKMTGLGNSFTGIMGKASALSAGFLGVAAAIRAISGTVKTIANFGFEMSKVEAISGATGNTLREMTSLAREMGATTMYTATEAGSALKFLSMAGFSAKESMQALPATLDLAQAGTIDLGRAADIASNIMASYRIEASKTNVVVDDMVSVVNNANTNVQQLGDAMKYVGAAASASNVDIPTTAAAIGVLSNAGMQGAMAGTGLRQVFIRLTNVTGASEDALSSMGLTLDQVNPQMVGLTAAITRLKEAGMTGGEAIRIFGARGAVAALNLAKGLGKYHELKDIMSENEGIANKTAKTMQNNLMGAFKLLKSAVQEAILGFGDKGFAGGLKDTVSMLTEFVRILAGTGDPLSKFHKSAMKMKAVLDKVISVAVIFFKVWAVTKIYNIVTGFVVMIKNIWGIARAFLIGVIPAIRTATAVTRLFSVALVSTGVGALIVGLGVLASMFMSTSTSADAATQSLNQLTSARAKWMKDQENFKVEEDEGTMPAYLDTGELKAPRDIKTYGELQGNINKAKEIQERSQVGMDKIKKELATGRLRVYASKAEDGSTQMKEEDFNRAVGTGYYEKELMDITRMLHDMGIEGEASWENIQRAQLKANDQQIKSKFYIENLAKEEIFNQVKIQIEAHKANKEFQRRIGFIKTIGEEARRASGGELSQSGSVELAKLRLEKSANELEELTKGVDLTEEEQKQANSITKTIGLQQKRLDFEEKRLLFQRAGNKGLEEELELAQEIANLESKRSELYRDKEQVAVGGKDASELINAFKSLDKIDEMREKIKESTSQGRVGTDAKFNDMFLDAVNAFGSGVDSKAMTQLGPSMQGLILSRQADMEAIRDKYFNKVTGKDGSISYEKNIDPKDSRKEAASRQEMMDVLNSAMLTAENPKIRASARSNAITYLKEFAKGLTENQNLLKEALEKAANVIEKDPNSNPIEVLQKSAAGAAQGEQELGNAIRKNNADLFGKYGDQSDLHNKNVLAMRKQRNEVRKLINDENESVEMQKRKLKLLGAKAGGKELAELEGSEALIGHMIGFQDTLRKKQDNQRLRKAKGEDVDVMTDDDIEAATKAEREVAASIIAQEVAKKAKEGGSFGVSSLAKIGGGGGVGAGGDSLLNAARLTNEIMRRAEEERKIHTGLLKGIQSSIAKNNLISPIKEDGVSYIGVNKN